DYYCQVWDGSDHCVF
nr:immunoglobulin light chain junction region [Macaca mulatta]